MTNEHTPGPWHVGKVHCGLRDVFLLKTGATIATVYEPEANATLVSAAPELLEACLRIIAVADLPLVHNDGTDTQVLGQVRDAINKALGR